MESRYAERRAVFKANDVGAAAAERRADALQGQQEDRQDLVNQMRVIAFQNLCKEDDDVEVEMACPKRKRKKKTIRLRSYFARQFMLADWLLDAPARFADEWLVYLRPEGNRCMLFSDGAQVCIRRKNGSVLKRFVDERFGRGETILEGVLVENHFVCTDILFWRNAPLMDATFECRYFFLQGRMEEAAWDEGEFKLSLVSADFATKARLMELYGSDSNWFISDGFQFMQKDGQYIPGLCPLALVWRDHHISRYAVDTDTANVVPEAETCVLQLRDKGYLRTEDRQVVAQLPEGAKGLKGIPPKALVKCRITAWPNEGSGAQKLEVELLGRAGRSRVFADSWARLVFQHGLRQLGAGESSFDRLLALVASQGD